MTAFETLGLYENATIDQVKQTWRQLAMRHHPDRGGDPAEFDRLRKAYEQALAEAQAPKLCDACNGAGKVQRTHGWSTVSLVCDSCGGTGAVTVI